MFFCELEVVRGCAGLLSMLLMFLLSMGCFLLVISLDGWLSTPGPHRYWTASA